MEQNTSIQSDRKSTVGQCEERSSLSLRDEHNESLPLLLTSSKKSRYITICSFFGLCRGLRLVPKSSFLTSLP